MRLETCKHTLKLLMSIILFVYGNQSSAAEISKYDSSLEYAQVLFVMVTQTGTDEWCFDTDVEHNDQGWEHYADGWEVIDPQGNQLGYRFLAHPHDNEQPFTRSLCGVKIPKDVTTVVVRAKCNVHGYGGKAVVIDFNKSRGENFRINKF